MELLAWLKPASFWQQLTAASSTIAVVNMADREPQGLEKWKIPITEPDQADIEQVLP